MREALCHWAQAQANLHPDLLWVGYIGSYARGDWGVGSDLDVILIVAHSTQPFWERSTEWDFAHFPVPVDVLVYTLAEWETLALQGGRFYCTVRDEALWVFKRGDGDGCV